MYYKINFKLDFDNVFRVYIRGYVGRWDDIKWELMEMEREGGFIGDGVISGLWEVLSGGDGYRDVVSVKERWIWLLSVFDRLKREEDDGYGVLIKVFLIK